MAALSWQHGAITTVSLPLKGQHGQVGVTVHVVRGENRVALIDSGVVWAYPALGEALHEMGVAKSTIKLLLLTHEHMDHIGNNGQLVAETGCLVAAHPMRADLIADNERNARSFVHRFPDVEPVFDLGPEYLDWMGPKAAPVNLFLREGVVIDLTGPRLEVIELPGHSPCEIGFFDSESRSLIFGDTLMPDRAPVLYLYEDPGQLRDTCRKIQRFVQEREVAVVLSGHENPMGGPEAIEWARVCLERTRKIEDAIIAALREQPGITLGALRDVVVTAFGKLREWRALITIHGHLDELTRRGVVERRGSGWAIVAGASTDVAE